jgi:Na+/proline symporter
MLPSEGAAMGATFGTLVFFLIATIGYVLLERKKMVKFDTDVYMSARNSQGAFSLTMSFFASGAGAWVLFTLPEAAILGGPIAVLGYAISCVLPLLIFMCAAPALRRHLPFGITFFEFVQARYGSLVNVYVTLIATFYMFLYLAAEFTSVGTCVSLLSTGDAQRNLPPIVGTSLVTLLYSTLGGLPVSLFTDKVQGVGVLVFTALAFLAVAGYALFPSYENVEASETAAANWRTVTSWGLSADPANSFKMAIVLIIAVTSANLMHTGYQQRIWAAQDNSAVKYGLIGASIITLPFILLFGFFGMIAFAQFGVGGLVAPVYLAFLGAFFVFQLAPTGWQVAAIILAVMMVASSADTIQTGLAGLFSPVCDKLVALGVPEAHRKRASFAISLLLTIVLNVVAIHLATGGHSVLAYFVFADLLCATCCVPVFLGLWDKIHPLAALAGCIAGLATALTVYGVGMEDPYEEGNFVTLFAPGGLYATTSLIAFVATPLVSGGVTLLVAIPFALQGYQFAGFAATDSAAATKTSAEATSVTLSAA